ncbi:acetyl-CoA carboxylase multifunctional carboxyl transferase subunit alpha/carboxyl transferase subunit beta/biotin carboxylase [Oleiphilus messinensis]|uniref:Acetyl-CoA carboxylase multifunctional carboxyl transferase subunit alpha/carboxyl transferase subunit beta/biotin carboxylase n=1 Tax=Oleiphilus messinensis TaxID=141451 RepID=A0A1Y0IB92_9GAMM|nr:biotin carboxylase N-terminal domain-containing protein [Oleiphilus messinensis]ARU57792.1 acetyl-CoA carboxylase multifunctional carboxyl transferase subunit alpha/carboxyl transferase subunit beta/biotin carboxylase [Oleiphilus messinensis]
MRTPEQRKQHAAADLFMEIERLAEQIKAGLKADSPSSMEASPSVLDGQRDATNVSGAIRFDGVGTAFLKKEQLQHNVDNLRRLSGDQYRDVVIDPVESSDRWSAVRVIKQLTTKLYGERKHGSLYLAQGEVNTPEGPLKLAFMAQNRKVSNGVWDPEHHRLATKWAREMESKHCPIITFMDTPGANAGVEANQHNQAHSISELIAVMADLTVPVVGIVLGTGYSGGAIPLAASNVMLAVKDALFSTIQPKGLAAIARKQRLSWQACAQLVGVHAAELALDGIVDGVVNYSPADGAFNIENLREAILESLAWIRTESRHVLKEITNVAPSYLENSIRYSTGNRDRRILHDYDIATYPSVFEYALKVQKAVLLRTRLTTGSVEQILNQSEAAVTPEGNGAQDHLAEILAERFEQWLGRKERIVYEDTLQRVWTRLKETSEHRGEKRSYVAALLFGDPEDEFEKAYNELCFEIAFHLYNGWQGDASHHLAKLTNYLATADAEYSADQFAADQLSVLDVIRDPQYKDVLSQYCQQLILLDRMYEVILDGMTDIVTELAEKSRLSRELMCHLMDQAGLSDDQRMQFLRWIVQARETGNLARYMQTAEQWKRTQHPRMSEVLFVVASYFFDRLFPDYYASLDEGKSFSGQFTPVSIGRRKDFWNRLVQAEKDLRIQAILNSSKPSAFFQPHDIISKFFTDFEELDADLTSANPRNFPGFGEAIKKQSQKGGTTSGVITGIARFQVEGHSSAQMGVLVSNHAFQAGAFDMSSAERFCRLMTECTRQQIPVVCFVCSGGMQTKEGASALFSMAVVNEHLNRFVSEVGLPVLVFGYGDCTGGAQASFVTHPLVHTWYFSGTNMPFAGRIVVPDFLPVTATLSNYLSRVSDSMEGLVQNPFIEDLDPRLKVIDPDIPTPSVGVPEVIQNWMEKRIPAQTGLQKRGETEVAQRFDKFESVLIHARGCTAVKLIAQVQQAGLKVILVQSDPDMTSVAAEMLRQEDELVCLGGFTSDESYLNGESVLRIAKLHGAQALHPGIGFLSENSDFAYQCLARGLNFIGPSPSSMAMMGDKSQAINTALRLNVPVVPGSHGLLKDEEDAMAIAREIGFPVILKAAHGGGGKGIVVVEDEASLIAKFLTIKAEARSSFGRDDIYLERFVTRFRHIEVQLLRDSHGNTQVVGLRDCSVQRNKQKIVEESGSTLLPEHQGVLAKECAAKLADACDYNGAGTVEYIYDLDRDQLYFMEMNTRLQVEHPVTELVSGVNIVHQQLLIAQGESIAELKHGEDGYAVEVRINAEQVSVRNGEIKVEPTPGKVELCDFPDDPDITRIVSVGSDKTVPPYYDNLIAQIVAYGTDRNDAVQKLSNYLARVKLDGVSSNIPLLTFILKDDVFLSGDYDTDYLPELAKRRPEELSAHLGKARVEDSATELDDIKVDGSDELKVFAPSNSILYRSPAPNKPAFIQEGDMITTDQTLCLLEVMKMFQPLTLASFNQKRGPLYPDGSKYKVTHIKGSDGQQINKGDLLFVVKPVA